MNDVASRFGAKVFSRSVMRQRLPKDTYRELLRCISGGKRLDLGIANVVANAMKDWAIEQGYKKIIVVKTRSSDYREEPQSGVGNKVVQTMYRDRPALAKALMHMRKRYNNELDELYYLTKIGRVFTIEPSRSLDTVGRLEPDMEKLGRFYYLGVEDCRNCLGDLKEYLNS